MSVLADKCDTGLLSDPCCKQPARFPEIPAVFDTFALVARRTLVPPRTLSL
jgi:hypothetical protein